MRVISAAVAVVSAQDKTDLQAAIAAVGKGSATFDEIRAQLAAVRRGRFTDGMIHQTALDLGLRVDSD